MINRLVPLDLYELADRPLPMHPVPGPGGVACYGMHQEGALISSNRARQLGAQLMLAAEEHDAIVDLDRGSGGS
jgi:hypothetical protein